MTRLAILAAQLAVVAAAVGYLVSTGRFALADLTHGLDRPAVLARAMLLLAAGLTLSFVRQWFVFRAQGLDIGIGATLRGCWIAAGAGQVALGGVMTDAVKAVWFAKGRHDAARIVAGLLADRLLALAVLVLFWFGAVGLLGRTLPVELALLLAAAASAGVMLYAVLRVPQTRWPRLAAVQRALGELVHTPHPRSLGLAFLLSVFAQVLVFLSLQAFVEVVDSVRRVPHILSVVLAGAPAILANLLPLPMGGLGVGELIFQTGLERAGGLGFAGAAAFLLFRLWMTALSLAGLVAFAGSRWSRRTAPSNESVSP